MKAHIFGQRIWNKAYGTNYGAIRDYLYTFPFDTRDKEAWFEQGNNLWATNSSVTNLL
jgi:hypothetical protein